MKTTAIALLLLFSMKTSSAQHTGIADTVEKSYFTTNSMEELMNKFVALPCGITVKDSMNMVLDKLDNFLKNYVPNPKYSDDNMLWQVVVNH